MFAVRSAEGEIVISNRWGEGNASEVLYDSYLKAEEALKEMLLSIPAGSWRVVVVDCDRCGGKQDIAIIHVNEEPKAYCVNCRKELFAKKSPVGRPTLGVTKKVSLTLPEDTWDWLDEKAEGNRSQFIREAVWDAMGSENKWDNYACLGYAIQAARDLQYEEEQIKQLVKAIRSRFDTTSVPVAHDIYLES